jgi:hypothetical protein
MWPVLLVQHELLRGGHATRGQSYRVDTGSETAEVKHDAGARNAERGTLNHAAGRIVDANHHWAA